ncbi:MAG: TetR/AcrR family transcriptional regulator [Actinomycetes bacterium]
MAKDRQRREEWTRAATDYALENGLIGLSLRPLAAALGTSDRMLLYHFGTKDDLVAAVLRTSNDRATEYIRSLPPSPNLRRGVHELWAAMRSDEVDRPSRLYIEAAALGLLGREPYHSVIREANTIWTASLVDHLVRSGVSRAAASRVVTIIDAAFMGFHLDLTTDLGDETVRRAVADLADAVAAIAPAR